MSAICFNNVLKTKPKEQLENAATKAKDELAKAQKVLDEYKNKDLSDEKRQLNDKLARLDELNLYVGRVDKNSPNDATIARLEARYGKKYQEIVDIVREKIDKENADEVLDISFAPKRSDESALSEKTQNLGIMSAENLEKGEKMSEIYDLKNKTLQEIMLKNEKIINYAFLKQIADDLPPALSKDEFIKAFAPNAKGRANIKTPIKDIEINVEQAWEHLLDNSKGEDRTKISGGLLQTLQKPFFVIKNDEGSYYFYKPFKDERGILNLISIEVPKAARLKYKTSYIADKNKMLELINKHELVYKSW